MTMPPRLRKVVLTTHVASSVGWLGAVVAYLAIDIIAATSQDMQLVNSAYRMMEVMVYNAIIPLALTSVVIGVINALGTPWGLFQHYWVIVKLVLTIFATTILLVESETVTDMAEIATTGDARGMPGTLLHSGGGIVVLLITTILSVYKPRGLTRYGWRKQQAQRRKPQDQRTALVSS